MPPYDMPLQHCGKASGASRSVIGSLVGKETSSYFPLDELAIASRGIPDDPAYPTSKNLVGVSTKYIIVTPVILFYFIFRIIFKGPRNRCNTMV